ncbi:MAG: hypothetical protein ILP16_00105, partial [Spirochaetales bacterium]|nr:hypothetical protein [Spirochaetales bacterium]
MRLFLLPATFDRSSTLQLTGKDFNYLIKALRLKKDQELMGRDRDGGLWNLRIEKIEKTSCILSVSPSEKLEEKTDSLPQMRPLKPIIL